MEHLRSSELGCVLGMLEPRDALAVRLVSHRLSAAGMADSAWKQFTERKFGAFQVQKDRFTRDGRQATRLVRTVLAQRFASRACGPLTSESLGDGSGESKESGNGGAGDGAALALFAEPTDH